MRAIIVMYDSLNRNFLPVYGNEWVHAPNFTRLAEKSATFDTCYIGSSPTIPTRREMHTGRYNFLHRSWGPLEPFDDSMPQILHNNGVLSHLADDCQHYWEDGGATYHHRYTTHEFSRGQEGDAWKGDIAERRAGPNGIRQQDTINRKHVQKEEDFPQSQTFAKGLDFLERNVDADNWMLQIETFDPHEPYYSPQKYQDLYPKDDEPLFDWPPYCRVNHTPEQISHVRHKYAALVSMCDANLGKVLDFMDARDMWKDTMLIVNTDHGFLLGEHGWFGKMAMPFYEEIARIPYFVWDPRSQVAGQRRKSLVQTIDIAPTLLDFFGFDIPEDMQGKPLVQTIADDTPVREAGLFGMHREHVNVTDGRYVYMRAPVPENAPLYDYTLMPTHMRGFFSPKELEGATLSEPLPFSKGVRPLKVPVNGRPERKRFPTSLFDLEADPDQESPVDNPVEEERMRDHLIRLMRESDAPAEQYTRLGLKAKR